MQRSERRLCGLMSCGCLLWAALVAAQLGRTHTERDDTGAVRELLADTLTGAERRWLAAHPVVRYSASPIGGPMVFVGTGGHAAGIAVQALEQVGRITGLRFEPVWQQDAAARDAALHNGSVLLVPALASDSSVPADAGAIRESGRKSQRLQPSLPYLITPWVIITHAANGAIRDASGLAGMRIAVRRGSRGLAERLAQVPNATIIRTSSNTEAYRMVAHGQADAAVDTLTCARYMVRRAFAPRLRVAGQLGPPPAAIGFGVSPAAPQLRMILNKALAAIPPTHWDALQADWASSDAMPARLRAAVPAAQPASQGRRPWLLTCSLGTMLWMTAMAACAVALHRHGRRIARAASTLHRRLCGTRAASRRSAARMRPSADAAHRAALPRPSASVGASAGKSAGASPGADRLSLLATICHEIRTPMHAVIGILDLLKHKTAIHGEARHYIDTAHDCAKSLVALVGDLLDMARLEAGRMEIRPEPVQLDTLLRQWVHAFRPLAASRGLRIRLQLGPLQARRHRADPQRLRQVVGNLLSNAIKFSGHGDITVKLESAGEDANRETIRIVVRDRGPGIAADQMPQLFEPFYRAAEAGATSGTGLGLSISRQLARQMGGDLELTSRPGHGTTALLTLTLPAEACAGRALRGTSHQTSARRPAVAPLHKGYCALIVDDHPAGRMLLARQLRHLGVEAVGTGDAHDALVRCAASDPAFDLVILDCNMPGMDGFTLARKLRAQERALARPRVPVLGYSADARPHNREQALAAGMDDCLFKPIDLDTLGRALQHWLGEPPAGRCPSTAFAAEPVAAAPDAAIRAALLAGNTADLAALRVAVARADWQAAHAIAHRIKGAARLVSADAVAAGCEALEAACRDGDPAAVAAAMAQLVPALARWARTLSS
ncbi:response regulator [Cupriavidus gilardii]|uniref:ATP-binding protein n=1 Tax=Cupriavidus gilardii TaxID=82541 RepID=UPI001ABEA5D4|nr:ATP-binding protein [Cupriavidus gilardii]MBO4122279.1 response regulator [Cupriavidus gilardii]